MPDEGWVHIYNPEQLEDPEKLPDPADPDSADAVDFALVTAESFELAWQRRGWRNLDEDLAAKAAESAAAENTSTEEQTPEPATRTGRRSTSDKES